MSLLQETRDYLKSQGLLWDEHSNSPLTYLSFILQLLKYDHYSKARVTYDTTNAGDMIATIQDHIARMKVRITVQGCCTVNRCVVYSEYYKNGEALGFWDSTAYDVEELLEAVAEINARINDLYTEADQEDNKKSAVL